MPTILMLPEDTTGINQWQTVGASPEAAVQSDDDDSSFIYETRDGHEITFTMANPGVAEETINFDEDVIVRPSVTAHYEGGSGTIDLEIKLTGTGIVLGSNTVGVAVDSDYPTYNGLSSTSKALFTPWDYAGLENARVKLECAGRPDRFSYLRVSYVYIRVDYTAAVVAAVDNSTFFGANF